MAWTRVEGSEIGGEPGSVVEWVTLGGGATNPAVSTTKFNTGARSVSFVANSGHNSAGIAFPSAVMVRAGMWLNHNGVSGATSDRRGIIFRWESSAGNTNYVRYNEFDSLIELVVNGSVVASATPTAIGITTTDLWYALGIVIYVDATNGWVTFYLDTQAKLTWNGNTGTGVTSMFFGGNIGVGWTATMYVDDFYIDISTIEETDESPTPHKFLPFVANGNGAHSDFTGSDADSTDNYLLVDDVPPDTDTTYVYAEAINLEDSYLMSDITVPLGYQVTAVIPKPMCKRVGTTETIKLRLRDAGANVIESGEKSPPSSYGFVSHRFTTAPDAGAWDETKVNAVRSGQITAGTFA